MIAIETINKNDDQTIIFPARLVASLTVEGATTYNGSRSIYFISLIIKKRNHNKKSSD